MALNVLTAAIGGGCQRATAIPSAVQWDRGQILQIEGVTLPFAYNVEFCCQGDATTVTMIGDASGVEIPNSLLERGLPVIAYIVLHEGEDDRETEYWITINVKARPQPTNVSPDPGQQDAIDQLIAELDAGVQATEDAAEAAEDASQAIQEMSVTATTLAPGSAASVTKTVDPETGAVNLAFGIPEGQQGQTGPQGPEGPEGPEGQTGPAGQDGVSPTVSVTTITGGHRVAITDATQTQTFDVMDGEDAVIDATLSHAGEAADAKATGDALSALNSAISETCTDATGLQLVDEEKLNTVYTEAFLNTLDRIFTELPQDDSLEDIYDEIVTEVSLLDQLYREVAAAVNA